MYKEKEMSLFIVEEEDTEDQEWTTVDLNTETTKVSTMLSSFSKDHLTFLYQTYSYKMKVLTRMIEDISYSIKKEELDEEDIDEYKYHLDILKNQLEKKTIEIDQLFCNDQSIHLIIFIMNQQNIKTLTLYHGKQLGDLHKNSSMILKIQWLLCPFVKWFVTNYCKFVEGAVNANFLYNKIINNKIFTNKVLCDMFGENENYYTIHIERRSGQLENKFQIEEPYADRSSETRVMPERKYEYEMTIFID